MMNEKYFESAEFYQKRFHNFASLWVVPCFLLLLFVVGFSVFAKKEVTLTSRGTIEATRVIDQIQSSGDPLSKKKRIGFLSFLPPICALSIRMSRLKYAMLIFRLRREKSW